MLTQKQSNEIKEHLEKAQNPVFYYDNDCDGLCSFLLLRRYLGRGKGVAVRSFPDLNIQYARKAKELNADYVFVLDKPLVSKEFVLEITEHGLPLVWIDHHNVGGEELLKEMQNVFIYNPALKKKEPTEEPVTYLIYNILKRKEDLWLAVIGCIADHYIPDFITEFRNSYREFLGSIMIRKPFDIYYGTEIGKIAQAFNFGLKDSTTHIVQFQNFLISSKGPQDIFLEIKENYNFRKKYNEIKKKYDALLERAKKFKRDKILFFSYSGDLSISADLANELSYLYQDTIICVAFRKGGIANLSMRGKNVKKILDKILIELKDGSGGGHEEAVGARIKSDDLDNFKRMLCLMI